MHEQRVIRVTIRNLIGLMTIGAIFCAVIAVATQEGLSSTAGFVVCLYIFAWTWIPWLLFLRGKPVSLFASLGLGTLTGLVGTLSVPMGLLLMGFFAGAGSGLFISAYSSVFIPAAILGAAFSVTLTYFFPDSSLRKKQIG
ncbi:hypothetical protein Pla123a_13760 [Posidoniimonas polymericola]|uniref:Uncharacterized protein n=1 Tax=Posidoniimonas polymericola TaxID=2528002 RepID=A0A5C5YU81_9BACT|nr:hypothetical protein [Posidoniimonas polymericola]TWT78582.1 hypothetical protein Pla123a_13760 [Posidoniimonas polymericola]